MKKKVILALAVLMVCMSSCVYSLFPIYTEDTLVYLPELVGKWQSGDDEENYILFERMLTKKDPVEKEDKLKPPVVYTDSIIGKNYSIRSLTPITVEVNGRLITDRDSIKMYLDTTMVEMVQPPNIGGVTKIANKAQNYTFNHKGAAHIAREESYKMIVMDHGERWAYHVRAVDLEGDIFLDLYPLAEYSDAAFGENSFPVHSFMKIELDENKLNMIQFDLEKLNKLFESNLIRLRHEMVDGRVLITAKPEELQKFFSKYSDDESVFDDVTNYTRVTE